MVHLIVRSKTCFHCVQEWFELLRKFIVPTPPLKQELDFKGPIWLIRTDNEITDFKT